MTLTITKSKIQTIYSDPLSRQLANTHFSVTSKQNRTHFVASTKEDRIKLLKHHLLLHKHNGTLTNDLNKRFQRSIGYLNSGGAYYDELKIKQQNIKDHPNLLKHKTTMNNVEYLDNLVPFFPTPTT